MIYLHDPHTEYTAKQVKEMHYEGNCITDCPHCVGKLRPSFNKNIDW